MSTGHAYRGFETSNHAAGTGGDLRLGGVYGGVVTNYQTIVNALKEATGIGTGPWSAEITIKDATNWEAWKVNVEEGTGPGGEDLVKRSTGTLQASSNSDTPVNWGSSVKDVFITPDAKKGYALFDALTTVGVIKRLTDQSYSILATGATGEALLDDPDAATARTTISACDRGLTEQTLLTTVGDLLYMNTGPAEARLPIGTSGQYLREASGKPAWTTLLASHAGYTPTSPLSGTNAATALDDCAGFFSAGFRASATSSEIAVDLGTGGNDHTFAHGLGVTPKLVVCKLKCTDAGGDVGYAQNDEVFFGAGATVDTGGTGQGWTVFADSTNVVLKTRASSSILVVHKTDGTVPAIDPTKWKFIIHAYR